MQHQIVLPDTQQVPLQKIQAPLTQVQQEGMQMTLKTGTVYPAKMIDSGVKAAFTLMYENNPKLKVMTWERIVVAAATDKKCLALADLV